MTVTATYTAAERLALVQNAIASIVAGAQATTIFGRQYVRADLRALQDLEKYYRSEVNKAARGGSRVRLMRPC